MNGQHFGVHFHVITDLLNKINVKFSAAVRCKTALPMVHVMCQHFTPTCRRRTLIQVNFPSSKHTVKHMHHYTVQRIAKSNHCFYFCPVRSVFTASELTFTFHQSLSLPHERADKLDKPPHLCPPPLSNGRPSRRLHPQNRLPHQ